VRPFDAAGLTQDLRLTRIADEAGRHGVPIESLPIRIGGAPSSVRALIEADARLERIGDSLVTRGALSDASAAVLRWLDANHDAHPHSPGASLDGARAACRSGARVAQHVVERMVRDGVVVVEGPLVRRAAWHPQADAAAAGRRAAVIAILDAKGRAPPSLRELDLATGGPVVPLLRELERAGLVVALNTERFASASAARADRSSDAAPSRTARSRRRSRRSSAK